MKIKSMASILIAGALIATSPFTLADRDDNRWGSRSPDVAPVNNQKYQDECGACHFAYQPGLLPERSWRKLMGSLNDHFGDNAELLQEDVAEITDYLVTNAGDHSNYRRSRKLMRSLRANETPLRITEIPYFVREHDEVRPKIRGNSKVRSMSNCAACHRNAAEGSYEEDEVNIPGVGRWED